MVVLFIDHSIERAYGMDYYSHNNYDSYILDVKILNHIPPVKSLVELEPMCTYSSEKAIFRIYRYKKCKLYLNGLEHDVIYAYVDLNIDQTDMIISYDSTFINDIIIMNKIDSLKRKEKISNILEE